MPAVPHGYNPPGASASTESAALATADAVTPRILIVDDSQPTARALAALLGGAGYATATAFRGADALDRARAAADDGAAVPPFAAAIVDIHLPDISGLVVSQKLREILGPQIPILILSGDTSMQMLNSLPHVGATYFFSKPVNSTFLLEQLKQWVPPDEQK